MCEDGNCSVDGKEQVLEMTEWIREILSLIATFKLRDSCRGFQRGFQTDHTQHLNLKTNPRQPGSGCGMNYTAAISDRMEMLTYLYLPPLPLPSLLILSHPSTSQFATKYILHTYNQHSTIKTHQASHIQSTIPAHLIHNVRPTLPLLQHHRTRRRPSIPFPGPQQN